MENLPRDLTFATGPWGQLNFGIDRSVMPSEPSTCSITNYGSNSESLFSPSMLNHPSYASTLSYNAPVGNGMLAELKSNATYGEPPARMYPSRLLPGRTPLGFPPQRGLPQHMVPVGWPTPGVPFPPSSMSSPNTLHTNHDVSSPEINMHGHVTPSTSMIGPLTGHFGMSLPPRPSEGQESALPPSWIPSLPTRFVRSAQCGDNSDLALGPSTMVCGEKSTTPSRREMPAINVSEFLNLPSQYQISPLNGIQSLCETVQASSVGAGSTPVYSSHDTVASHSPLSSKFMSSSYAKHVAPSDETVICTSQSRRDADNGVRVCGTASTPVAEEAVAKKTARLGNSGEFGYDKSETFVVGLTVGVTEGGAAEQEGWATGQEGVSTEQATPTQSKHPAANDRQRDGKYGERLSPEMRCKSENIGVDESTRLESTSESESCRSTRLKSTSESESSRSTRLKSTSENESRRSTHLKSTPESEPGESSSGETEIADGDENGRHESMSKLDECSETDSLTGQDEQQSDGAEPEIGEAVDSSSDSLTQRDADDKTCGDDEQTFSSSNQFVNNPASCNGTVQHSESDIIGDGLWSHEMSNVDLHGNSRISDVDANDDQSASVPAEAVSSSQSPRETSLSLFNMALLTPFADSPAINVHIEERQCVLVNGQRRWKCLLCPKVYSTKHNLVTHILGHSGIKPHSCPVCGKLFKQSSHLQTHALTHTNVKPYSCQVCSRAFTQASHVKRHMAVHMERRPHACDLCDRGFVYPSELRVHRERHKNGAGNACEECSETFESLRRLKQHKATVHKDASDVTCGVCAKTFTYPSQLRDHMFKHGGKRSHMCTECGMDFMKEHHLRAHQFTHTGLKPYTCATCCRSFNQKANLQRHQLIHQDLRRYRCNICGRDFSQPQVLKAHIVTHASRKPHECKICGKQFSRLHNLKGHVHMHKGTKPHVCLCGASFTLKGNLNRHCKEKHCQDVDASDAAALCKEEYVPTTETQDEELIFSSPLHAAVARASNEDSAESAADSAPPKKKHRKSRPRKNIVSQNGDVEDEEIEAAWRHENAVDELLLPSRLITDPAVVVPMKETPIDVRGDPGNVQLIGAVKRKRNVSRTVDGNRSTVTAKDAPTQVFTSLQSNPKLTVSVSLVSGDNDSTAVARSRPIEKRTGLRRSSRRVSYIEDDLDYNDDYTGLTPSSEDPEWATCFSGGLKRASKKTKMENDPETPTAIIDQSCVKSSPVFRDRKDNDSLVIETANTDCNTDGSNSTSGDSTNTVAASVPVRRGPRVGKKASLAALMATQRQPERPK